MDFVRLNHLLAITTCLIMPIQRTKYIQKFRVWPCIFYDIVRNLNPLNYLNDFTPNNNNNHNTNTDTNHNSWIDFNKVTMIDINDIDSLYNWLSIRHYFLEFGRGFRQRELAILGYGIVTYFIITASVVVQVFIFDIEYSPFSYFLVSFALGMYLLPTLLTINTASKIQRNFEKEIAILKKRKIEENLEYSHKMNKYQQFEFANLSQSNKLSNAIQMSEKLSEYYSTQIGFETIICILENDFETYSFRMLGIRVDQGVFSLIVPIILSGITVFVRSFL